MPIATVAQGPTLRHGKARAYAIINEHVYRLRRLRRDHWVVTNNATGADYQVGRTERGHYCTCPDHLYRDVRCKHVGALLALRLISFPRRKVVADV